MPCSDERDIVLSVIDRRIGELERLAVKRFGQERWCEHSRARYVAEQMRSLRTEITRNMDVLDTMRLTMHKRRVS
jgi:hypothetical protein